MKRLFAVWWIMEKQGKTWVHDYMYTTKAQALAAIKRKKNRENFKIQKVELP